MKWRVFVPLVVILSFLMLPSVAISQEKKKSRKKKNAPVVEVVEEVKPSFTAEQLTLNELAAEATLSGDFARAETLFLANLELGEFDVTWLNLGRTYQRQGKCVEARDAYKSVSQSTVLPDSGIDVPERVSRYMHELNAECAEQFERIDAIGLGDGGYFTTEQISLNEQAAEATQAGDYENAILLFQANLRLGEFDITWLNLGRTYAKAGRCVDARDAYEHVLQAPISRDSVNMKIGTRLEQFQQELYAECSEAFHEWDTWPEVSRSYNIAGGTLLGIGLAAAVAGGVLLALDIPTTETITEKYYDVYSRSYSGTEEDYNNYIKDLETYKAKAMAAQYVPLTVGLSVALAGAGVLIADYIKYGDRKKALKAKEEENTEEVQDNAEELEETVGMQRILWTPSVVLHPEYSSVGAVVYF